MGLDAEHRPLVSLTPFPSGTRESEWRLTRSRHSDDVNAEAREAVYRDGYALFPALENSEIIKRSFAWLLFRAGTGRDIARFLLDCILRRK